MIRLGLFCASLLFVSACKGREEPAEPPAPSTTAEAPSPASVEAPELPSVADTEPAAEEPSEQLAAEPVEAVEPEPAPVQPTRDLGAELRAAVGSPADCLRDYQPASAKLIRIEISAVVRPTGMIIEPNASGGGLSNNDLRCVEQRIGSVVLSPLSGEASTQVSTFVSIQYEPPEVEEYDVDGALPERENVVPSLPKKKPIAPSGKPIEGPAADPIDGPSGVPIEGPKGVPIEGPKPKPINGY